ncbi:DUF4112 domain-containing protein [Algirhabdus cladophorae]|uniref:DUF4112 domain-containing protein n=1 Tax=Algirhabdus cladophorae TaxID=3377108 RepID=UPI003B8499CE
MSAELEKFERWSEALDSQFSVLGVPVGWDSILGLVPGVGDAVTIVPAALMIRAGHRKGIRKRALGSMVWNTGLDLVVGAIPFFGDLFDFAFKSHKKNVAVLRTEFARLERRASAKPMPA